MTWIYKGGKTELWVVFFSFCFLLDLARLLEELKKKEEWRKNWPTIHVELRARKWRMPGPLVSFQTIISTQPRKNAPISDDTGFGGNKFIC